jgi:hypothetical protein
MEFGIPSVTMLFALLYIPMVPFYNVALMNERINK